MNTTAYTVWALNITELWCGCEKKIISQNILNTTEQREKIKANQSTVFFFVLFNWFLKAPVTIVTPVGLLITKFVKHINYSELLGGKTVAQILCDFLLLFICVVLKNTPATIANEAWRTSH